MTDKDENSTKDTMIPMADVDELVAKLVNEQFQARLDREEELKVNKMKARQAQRDVQTAVYEKYSGVMKDSDEPWVDLHASEPENGQMKIKLDWNDAFIDHLQKEGLTGVDEDQIVHKWLSMLMQKVANDTSPTGSELAE